MCPEPTDPRDWHLLGLLVTIFLELLNAVASARLGFPGDDFSRGSHGTFPAGTGTCQAGLLVMMMLLALLRSLSALACARQVLLGRPLRAP